MVIIHGSTGNHTELAGNFIVQMQAQTLRLQGPMIDVSISSVAMQNEANVAVSTVQGKALIDTGSSLSCIDTAIVHHLGLLSIGSSSVHSASEQHVPSFIYQVNVELADSYKLADWPVTEMKLQHLGAIMLIGRDVLALGTLHYNGALGHYTLSF